MLVPLPNPWVPNPEQFSGDRKTFEAFKNAYFLYLALKPRTLTIDTVKVRFIISLLSDEHRDWAHSLLEQKSPIINFVDSVVL